MDYPLIQTLMNFAVTFGLSSVLVVAFLILYARVTPQEELHLIRDGNAAAALAVSGAMVGFIIALTRAVAISTSITEMLLWGLIALVVQALGHMFLSMMLPRLSEQITANQISAGIITASVGLGLGLINAAAMTG